MKWLCLHGYGQNAQMFQRQRMLKLRKTLEKSGHQLDFLQGPWTCSDSSNPDPHCWWYCETPEQTLDYVRTQTSPVQIGLETSVQLIQERWMTGQYQGLLGFSQGANIICHLLETRTIVPEQVVLICGFWKREQLRECAVPALCIHANQDQLVPHESFLMMTSLFQNPQILYVDGPHAVPSRRKDLDQILKHLEHLQD